MSTTTNAVPLRTLETWNIDVDHSEVGFAVKHLMVSTVRGSFRKVTGSIVIDSRNIERSHVEAVIDASSIETRQAQRDAHLRSPDFFDVENFPDLRFRSTRVEQTSADTLRVVGDLTIRGITRPVTLEVEQAGRSKDPWGGERTGFSATTRINRADFGLTWNAALETGGFVVGDEVKITLEIEAILS